MLLKINIIQGVLKLEFRPSPQPKKFFRYSLSSFSSTLSEVSIKLVFIVHYLYFLIE